MTAPARIVVVGAGVAGHRCALELRACGFDGEVVLVGAEPELPYDRTLLSKDFLQGTVTVAELALATRDDYEAQGIDVRPATAAIALVPARRELVLGDGGRLGYDRLVIATGGVPARPAALRADAGRVLRTLIDAERLRAALSDARRVTVIGGGFVGGEVASVARALGIEVTLVEALAAPLARTVGTEVGARIAELHRAHGVDVQTSMAAAGIREVRGGVEVVLADGRVLRSDVVLVGAGMAPATDWLVGSGVELAGGVVTDALCRTVVPDVLAAGDCARWWHPRYGTYLRVEHWDTAGRHGAAAARSALDEGEPFAPVPFFWSTQHGVRLQSVGHIADWDSVEIEDDDPPHSFVARYRRGGRLVAAFAAAQPRAVIAARRELETLEEVPT